MRKERAVPSQRSFSHSPPVTRRREPVGGPPQASRAERLDVEMKHRRESAETFLLQSNPPLTRNSGPSLRRKDSLAGPAPQARAMHRATRCSTVPGRMPVGDEEKTPDAGGGRRNGTRAGSLVDEKAASTTRTRRPRDASQVLKKRRASMEISVRPRDSLDELRGVLKIIDPPHTSKSRAGKTRSSPSLPREKKPAPTPPRAPVQVHVRKGASLADHERLTPKRGASPVKYEFRNQLGSPRRVKKIPIKVEKQQPSRQASVIHPPQPPTLLQIANSLLAMERHTENFERAQRGEAFMPPPKKED